MQEIFIASIRVVVHRRERRDSTGRIPFRYDDDDDDDAFGDFDDDDEDTDEGG